MKRGFILQLVRQSTRNSLTAGVVFCCLSALVFLINYVYVYNWLSGPFQINAQTAQQPGKKEFFRADGPVVYSGIAQEKTTTTKLFKGLIENKSTDVSARYQLMLLEDRFLVMKTEPDFSGNSAQGRLVPLPENVRTILAAESDPRTNAGTKAYYGYMLDATSSYRTDFNLFVLIAAIVFPISTAMLISAALDWSRPERHSMLVELAKYGPVHATVRKIEQEIMATGDSAKVGLLFITDNWILDSAHPAIFPVKDIIAVVKKVTLSKNKPQDATFKIELWLRGARLSKYIEGSNAECDLMIKAIESRFPWALITGRESFERQWRRDPKQCAQEMESRKKQIEVARTASSNVEATSS
jgi:hypothetical protein